MTRFLILLAAPALLGLTRAAEPPAPPPTARSALRVLSARDHRTSHPDALLSGFEAYYRYRDSQPGTARKPYLFFVDFGLDNRTPRGYVFDMERLVLVDGPFMVAHGRGSSNKRDGVPTHFSNEPNSKATSLGLYLTKRTYDFRGSVGGTSYTSLGLRLEGESGRFNDAAEARGIVMHGAPYVTSTSAGRSEGCPAIEPERAERLIPLLADGSVVFLYSPNDAEWLREVSRESFRP